jgi:predicted secreted protein
MGFGTAFAIYFIIWWVVLFTVLPFWARSQADEGEVTLGTTHSAPANFRFAPIFWRTTLISANGFRHLFPVVTVDRRLFARRSYRAVAGFQASRQLNSRHCPGGAAQGPFCQSTMELCLPRAVDE